MQINSYNENVSPEAFTAMFSGNGNFNIPNWRLSAKLKQPITSNTGGYILPANKISFQPVSTTGDATPGPVPNITQIGMPVNVFLQEGTEVFLVPNSNAPFYNQSNKNGTYYSLQIKFNMMVAGGSYLSSYPSWSTFTAPIEFTAYDKNNNIIGRMNHEFQFQIGTLTGTPPIDKELSLQINKNAVNGLLEFKTLQDYANGTSVTYNNALTVKTNTNFQIKVKSIQSSFTSIAGNNLPLNAVQMTLISSSADPTNTFPIYLSATNQLIGNGSATKNTNFKYDIKYYTSPNNQSLINAKPEEYSTTLQFEITPQ